MLKIIILFSQFKSPNPLLISPRKGRLFEMLFKALPSGEGLGET